MVKKREETKSIKRKRDTITSSRAKESLEVGSDGNCRTNSSRATRSRSVKRDSKSVQEASSEKGSENLHDSKETKKQSEYVMRTIDQRR